MVVISELKTFYRIYADTRNENTGKIVAKQNDTKTRYLDITVTDNGVPVDLTGCEVRIYGRKKDGTEFYNNGTLQDATTGRCLFEATTQMLAYAGQNANCEVVVFKDNEQILSTMPFDIFVVKSLMGTGAIESSNEYGALVVLFQNLYEAYDLMTRMVENIGNPSEIAAQYNLATMWQAWEFLTDFMKTDLTNKIDEAISNSSTQGVLDELESVKEILTPEHGVDSFDTAGTYTWNCPSGVNTASIVIVGAGGGGAGGGGGYSGSYSSWTFAGGGGGGGGAGAIVVITLAVVPGTEYKVVVGAGGAAGVGGAAGNAGGSGGSGGKSQFDKIIVFGGSGGSGGRNASASGAEGAGGSGGAGGTTITVGDSGGDGSGGSSGSGGSKNGTSVGGSGGAGGGIDGHYDIGSKNGTGGSGGAGGTVKGAGSDGSTGKDGLVYIIY